MCIGICVCVYIYIYISSSCVPNAIWVCSVQPACPRKVPPG